MYFSKQSLDLAQRIVESASSKGFTIASAESCTGGLIAACLTEISGASLVFTRGFITYANDAKIDLLGVSEELIDSVGAVSEEVARAMAEGALARADADLAVSVTGIAGPDGGTATKPVGLVHMAAARKGGETLHQQEIFSGDRGLVRSQSVESALALLLQQAETAPARG